MDAIVGSSTGVIKGIYLAQNDFTNLNFSPNLNKQDENVSMCWTKRAEDSFDDAQTEFLCALLSRQLKFFDTADASNNRDLFSCNGGDGKICGLEMVDEDILTCVESGMLKLWTSDGKDKMELSVGPNVRRMRNSPKKPNLVATGGKENPLKIWDLSAKESQKPIFVSKNVRHDWLELRVPVWDNDFRFLENDELIATCTGNHSVRLYDRRTEVRRPVLQIDWTDHPFTAMSMTHNERQVIVGSSRGFMGQFDLRSPGKLVHTYKGFAGSISAIEVHPTLPYVASCGLDRFVRVHHLNSRKMLHKIYCKAHLNTLLLNNALSIDGRTKKIIKQECESEQEADSGNEASNTDRYLSDFSDDKSEKADELATKEGKKLRRKIKKRKLIDPKIESASDFESSDVTKHCSASILKRKFYASNATGGDNDLKGGLKKKKVSTGVFKRKVAATESENRPEKRRTKLL